MKAACCRNIEIILHTTTLSIFNVLWCDASSTYYIIYIYNIYIIYIYIYIQNTNIKRNCDTLIQSNDNKTTIDFEHTSVRNLWSFYYRLIGLRCHNYDLYLCFVYK